MWNRLGNLHYWQTSYCNQEQQYLLSGFQWRVHLCLFYVLESHLEETLIFSTLEPRIPFQLTKVWKVCQSKATNVPSKSKSNSWSQWNIENTMGIMIYWMGKQPYDFFHQHCTNIHISLFIFSIIPVHFMKPPFHQPKRWILTGFLLMLFQAI
jgi:hypothetical protein